MVHSESSGDARHGLSRENSGETLKESERPSESVPAGQPADPDPDPGVSEIARESQLIPRSIPPESHGLDHPRTIIPAEPGRYYARWVEGAHWAARCNCGWIGPARTDKEAATADLADHVAH